MDAPAGDLFPPSAPGAVGFNRVYVGNLPWSATNEQLMDIFSDIGTIVTAEIMYGRDGRSRGCGLVTFSRPDEAQRAMAIKNNMNFEGRTLNVREDREQLGVPRGPPRAAKPMRPRPRPAPSTNFSAAYGGEIGSTVYVGNLSWGVSWQDLKDHMRQAGEVVHAEVLRSSDGRSKGCGLVRYSNAAEAKTAIETLTDTDLAGRPIIVREDREENKYKSGASVFVGNLPWTTSWQNLKDYLRDYGSILHVEIMTDPTGRSKGAAIVRFAEPADAQKAIDELNGTDFEGRPLILRPDRNA